MVCVATAAAGLTLAMVGISSITVSSALAGLAFGFLMMLPGHVFGATGAGDVKLFAAAGTLLGSGRIVSAFLCVAIAGGILAVVIAFRRTAGDDGTTSVSDGRKVETNDRSPDEHNSFLRTRPHRMCNRRLIGDHLNPDPPPRNADKQCQTACDADPARVMGGLRSPAARMRPAGHDKRSAEGAAWVRRAAGRRRRRLSSQ